MRGQNRQKTDLVKKLIFAEILSHRALVKNACQNEMSCFEAYLVQRREVLESYPIDRLEALVKGLSISTGLSEAA
jgi:hypothetical protein